MAPRGGTGRGSLGATVADAVGVLVVHGVRRAAQDRSVGGRDSFPTKTLQPSRGNPQYSVPITGTFVAGLSGVVLAVAGHDRLDVGAAEPDGAVLAASLVNGRKLYPDQLHAVSWRRREWATVRSASTGCRRRACSRPRGQGSQRWLHLRDDPQRTWCDADVQPDRRDGTLGRGELRARPAGQAGAAGADRTGGLSGCRRVHALPGRTIDCADTAGPVHARGWTRRAWIRPSAASAAPAGARVRRPDEGDPMSGHDGEHTPPPRAELAALAAQPTPPGVQEGGMGCGGRSALLIFLDRTWSVDADRAWRAFHMNWLYFAPSRRRASRSRPCSGSRPRDGRARSSGSSRDTSPSCRSRSCSSC